MFCSTTNPREYGMGKKEENTDFVCIVCQKYVMSLKRGSYRNHCPFCLSSLHVDALIPGDRESSCHGIMKAYRLKYNGKKGWQIVHKCLKCGHEKLNLIAEGDVQSDDWSEIVKLSQRPVSY
jgi:DNA-directed RNA polymerase subunit RPC12/RpoP